MIGRADAPGRPVSSVAPDEPPPGGTRPGSVSSSLQDGLSRAGQVHRAGRVYGAAAPGTAPSPTPRSAPTGIRRTSARGFRGAPPVVVVVSHGAPAVSAARLATRASVSGIPVNNADGQVRVRAVWAFPVLTVVVVVLTWMDVGVLRADKDDADAAQRPSPSPAAAPLRSN